MSVTVETGTTLAFDRFWSWLKRHANCILRAGTPETTLFDQEDLHWHLDEDEERVPIVQVLRGKHLLGEMILEVREILFVQALPDPEGEQGQYTFELIGGGGDEPYAVYHFVLAHGFEEEASHRAQLKQ
jgi:hypothetical protein